MKACPACGNSDNRDEAKRCDQCGSLLPAAPPKAKPPSSPPASPVAVRQAAKVDRTRRFKLPGVQDLTHEQDLANDLPMTGRHLLIGGPGTGKSVIALLRASRLVRTNKPSTFLAYNRLLIHYCRALVPVLINANTWIAWFKKNWFQQMKQSCPVLKNDWEIDWQAIDHILGQAKNIPSPPTPYLVIDEGQDMPERFYWILADLGFEHLFVAADFNQVLNPGQNVNRRELIHALEKAPRNVQRVNAPKEKLFDPSAIIELNYNHRNPGPVARLANYLCRMIANPQSPCPELRNDMRDAELPILFGYEPNNPKRDLEAVSRSLVLMADRNPRWLIGVLCPTKAIRDDYKRVLDAAQDQLRDRLDHGKTRIEIFDSNQQKEPDFTQGGIVILTAQSCKGLEFEVAVIADIHWYRNETGKHQLFYVMVSRAIERVILLCKSGEDCPINAILPHDQNLLIRDPSS